MSNSRFEKDAKGLEELLKVLGNQALVILKDVEEDDGIYTVETSTEGRILPSSLIQNLPRGAKGLKKLLEKGDLILVVSVNGDKLITACLPKPQIPSRDQGHDQNRNNNNQNNPGTQPNANNQPNPNPQGQNNPNGGGQQPAQTQPQTQPKKGLFERLWTPKVFD